MPTKPNDAPERDDAPRGPETAAETGSDASETRDTASSGPSSATRFDPDQRPKEYGGPKGPDPVRYGDWEKNGRCIDF